MPLRPNGSTQPELVVAGCDVQMGCIKWPMPELGSSHSIKCTCGIHAAVVYLHSTTCIPKAAVNGLMVVDTVTDGNCGLHAFLKSTLSMQELRAKRSEPWASFAKYQRDGAITKAFRQMRDMATAWIKQNLRSEIWPGFCLADLIRTTSTAGTVERYLESMSRTGCWADATFIHALASSCNVDVIVFQDTMEPALLGSSLGGNEALCVIPIALVNNFHYWAMESAVGAAMEARDKGDPCLAGTVLPQPTDGSTSQPSKRPLEERSPHQVAQDEGDYVELLPCGDESHVDEELTLCNLLLQWSPFASPTAEVVAAVDRLGALRKDMPTTRPVAEAALARQSAIKQLACECEALQARSQAD